MIAVTIIGAAGLVMCWEEGKPKRSDLPDPPSWWQSFNTPMFLFAALAIAGIASFFVLNRIAGNSRGNR